MQIGAFLFNIFYMRTYFCEHCNYVFTREIAFKDNCPRCNSKYDDNIEIIKLHKNIQDNNSGRHSWSKYVEENNQTRKPRQDYFHRRLF